MKFITLHSEKRTYLVNPITITCMFEDGNTTRVCFDGTEYIIVKETLEEIAALIEGR